MDTPESLRRSLTEGVADWLVRLVDSMPATAPPRTDSTSEAPVVAGWLHRFVRDVVTADPVTREPLSNIQIFLIESALDCVDWEALASSAAAPPRLGARGADPALKGGVPVRRSGRAARSPGPCLATMRWAVDDDTDQGHRPQPQPAAGRLHADRAERPGLRPRVDPARGESRAALLHAGHRAGPLQPPTMGRGDRIPGRRLLAVPDQHVPPRRLAAHHRQHVVAVDLRRQRRGPHGAAPIHPVLPGLRPDRGGGPLVHQPGLGRPDGRGLRGHRGRAGRPTS